MRKMSFENIVEIGENAENQYFLLVVNFLSSDNVFYFVEDKFIVLDKISFVVYTYFQFGHAKILSSGKGLTLL